jgi:succinyl-CoA synthetase beta subunit
MTAPFIATPTFVTLLTDEQNPKDVRATKNDLSCVTLDGTIGYMVNGAGLAMAAWILFRCLAEVRRTSI